MSWTSHGSDPESLLQLLLDLYWNTVQQELRQIILALAEFMQACPEPTKVEVIPPSPNRDRQNKFAKAWVGSLELDDDQLSHIRHVFKNWTTEDHSKPLIQRRAKQLLQSAGWLDFDFVHSDRLAAYPSMKGLPKVREIDSQKVFQAIQCSVCRSCIRTHYFECTAGCLDKESVKNHYKCIMTPKSSEGDISHLIPRMQATAFRICISCMARRDTAASGAICETGPDNTPLPGQAHLRMANLIERHITPEAARFSAELDALEDAKAGSFASATALVGLTMTRLTPNGVRKVFPAGNVHLAFRFGPLMIENGADQDQLGAMMSQRDAPTLLYDKIPNIALDIEDLGVDRLSTKIALSAAKPEREIFVRLERTKKRRTLAIIKQICGGLFTNYSIWDAAEARVINLVSEAASAYAIVSSKPEHPMARSSPKRDILHKYASDVTSVLSEAFGSLVHLHLSLIVIFLMEKSTKLTWHPISNNCQAFCNAILSQLNCGTVHWKSGDRGTLPYLHSFASPAKFPLFPQDSPALSHSDLGAYMSSLHNSSDLVSFAHGRKLSSIYEGQKMKDVILFKLCDYTCKHRESLFDSTRKLENPTLYLSDHILDDPFVAMALLSSHLERPRTLNVNEEGRAWSGTATEQKQRWVENRIHCLVAMDIFLSFTKAVSIVCRANIAEMERGSREGIRRESSSSIDGRATYQNYSEGVDFSKWWDMHPMQPPAKSLRTRFGSMLKLTVGGNRNVPWEMCSCKYCSMTDEELARARGLV